MRFLRRPYVLLLLLAPITAGAWAPGATIDSAVVVDITDDGFDELSDMVPGLVPSTMDLGDMHQEGEFKLDLGFYTVSADWDLYVTNLWLGTEVLDARISPGTGVLNLDATIELWVNNSSDKSNITFKMEYLGTLADCDTYVDPFLLDMQTTIAMEIVDDGVNPPWLDATIAQPTWSWDITNDDVHLDCWIGTLDTILDYIGLSPIDMMLDYAADEIDGMLADTIADLELTLEEAFSELSIEEEVSLGETTMTVALAPSAVDIVPEGMRISTAGSFDAPQHPCIDEYGYDSAEETSGTPPDIGDGSSSTAHHLGIFADDDFLNQALFTAWWGGALCYSLTEEDGLPINTSLLGLLAPGAYDDLFPDVMPMQIVTRPAKPPTVSASGDHDLNANVEDLGLDFYAELDYRMALAVGVDLDTAPGVDLTFDGTTGDLAIDVAFSADDLTTTVRHNELAPGKDEQIASSFGGLFDTLVAPMLGDVLSDLAFALPSYEGIGLSSLEVEPSGPQGDFLGLYGTVGSVDYAGGCEGEDSGCGGGCGTGAVLPARGILVLVPLLAGVLRRRRSSAGQTEQ